MPLLVVLAFMLMEYYWKAVSGRRDSNPRPSAWEADALPLSYSRMSAVMAIGAEGLW
jgi:hypothetical protein